MPALAVAPGFSSSKADALSVHFTEMMHGSAEAAADKDLRQLRALAGVARFSVRVRCALLAWNALLEAAKQVRTEVRD